MADRNNSERLRGFCNLQTDGQTDGRTDICDSRVAFATENFELEYIWQQKIYKIPKPKINYWEVATVGWVHL